MPTANSPAGVSVEIEPNPGGYLMTVCAPDRPGLFACVCGALASFGMNILKGEASSNEEGYVRDLIRFADPMRTLELNPAEFERLRSAITDAIQGSADVRQMLQRRRRVPPPSRSARIAPSVRFDNEASDTSTLIDFVGPDFPGLLYELASTLSAAACNIEVVLIDTQGPKALDVFYVTSDGRKLDEQQQQLLRSELVRAADMH